MTTMETTKKELDDILLRLQQIQRETFRLGSPTGIAISLSTSFSNRYIDVAASNKTQELRRADGQISHSKGFSFADYKTAAENAAMLRELEDFLVVNE